jgi:putative transcriptional regulator
MIKRCLDELLRERSRYWLAHETGISEGNLGKLARQETSGIEFETLEKICRVLNCGPGDLLVLADDKKIVRKRYQKAAGKRSRKKRSG